MRVLNRPVPLDGKSTKGSVTINNMMKLFETEQSVETEFQDRVGNTPVFLIFMML